MVEIVQPGGGSGGDTVESVTGLSPIVVNNTDPANPIVTIQVANTSQSGYLTSTDWNTFNNKQVAGSYITALTGDATATGPGSVALTLATVNSNAGSFGSATASGTFTVNGKGLITAATNVTITPNFANILGGTAGSVIFSNGTNLAQDNANFFWDDTNNRLGLGKNSSLSAKLHIVNGSTSEGGIIITDIGGQTAPAFQVFASDGTTNRFKIYAGGTTEIGDADNSTFFNALNVGGNIGTNQGMIRVQNSGGTPIGGFTALGLIFAANTLYFTQPTGGEGGQVQVGASGRNTNDPVGQPLTILGNGAQVGSTNRNAGDVTISAGTSTGTGTSALVFKAPPVGSSGTGDNAPVEIFRVQNKNIGIGTSSPTALIQIKAGTATANTAPLKFTSGTNTTIAEAGALEYDGNRLWFTSGSTYRESLVGTLFTQTASKTVANTTTETSIVGTGVGTGLTLSANFFVAGKTIEIIMSGVYSTTAVTGDTVTVRVKYGSTTIASKATTALVTGGTNLYWQSNLLITCRTVGATGTVQPSGAIQYQVAGSAAVIDELNNAAGTATIDTTASSLLDVTIQHSATGASNTVTSLVGSFKVLN